MPVRTADRHVLAASAITLLVAACLAPAPARAGVALNIGTGLAGGSRWDAAPRNVTLSGVPAERSLDGGLRYSVQGGNYQAFRDLFTWNSVPTVPAFTAAVGQAFNAWASADPASGLASGLSFVSDVATPVVGSNTGNGGVDARGAEIDLFGSNDAFFWNPGGGGTQAETSYTAVGGSVRLTSGTVGYASNVITGADIILNSNTTAVYSLDIFRRLLTHEIGHTLGLGDVEGSINPGAFIDDNYDGSTSATALATLTNSWAGLVNPLNPAASVGLSRYTVPYANPGTTTPGVDILMETNGVGIGSTNPATDLVPLRNDDYGTRQFLYPTLAPEPATLAALAGVAVVIARRRRAV